MRAARQLSPDELRAHCDPDSLGFATTAELPGERLEFGQQRALEAARFGFDIGHRGYNVFAMGPAGLGKRVRIEALLQEKVAGGSTPLDWCYVHNFDDSYRPRALELPAGRGAQLRRDMEALVETIAAVIPAAFDSEEYQTRIQELEEEYREHNEHSIEAVAKQATAEGIRMVKTPGGFAFAPSRDGEVLGPEEFEKLSEEEQKKIQETIVSLQESVQDAMREAGRTTEKARQRLLELNREVALAAIEDTVSRLQESWKDLPDVIAYLSAVQTDMVEHADEFRAQPEQVSQFAGLLGDRPRETKKRYEVNVVSTHDDGEGAPVVYEDHPTYQNLVGRVEHRAQFGALHTDFTLIKPGALHRANGGYLILDARDLIMQPYAWEGLKSALRTQSIRIESLGEALSLVSTVSLEPAEIRLSVKVILLGDRMLYYALLQYDPEFAELFKIAADFEETVKRDSDSSGAYARMVATVALEHETRAFDKHAVARIVDEGARHAADAEKLSLHASWLTDIVRESDYLASIAGSDVVRREDVDKAIDLRTGRSDRIRSLAYEAIERETILIDTEGEEIGQVNGLSVLGVGAFAFGQPSRITATARLGQGRVVDIEREVDLGGAYHSKGVLILSNFLADRYARERTLALSASLVFEQSYGRVDGDSASTAELCALLSALADVPVKQSCAITGSVNQRGGVQAIGGVNEKIDGFFDVCRSKGLSGDQGVIIPEANMKHLMLREDVVEAVRSGKFHVWAVDTVDAALEILTGLPAGERDDNGVFPDGTINRRVEDKLVRFAKLRERAHTESNEDDESNASDDDAK
jgi:predicted ATP-dependent protease